MFSGATKREYSSNVVLNCMDHARLPANTWKKISVSKTGRFIDRFSENKAKQFMRIVCLLDDSNAIQIRSESRDLCKQQIRPSQGLLGTGE